MKLKSNLLNVMLITVVLLAIFTLTVFSAQAAPAREKKVCVQLAELPAGIKKAIDQACPNGEIIKIEKEIEGEDPGQYDIYIRYAEKKYEVEISAEGKVVEIKETKSAAKASGSEKSEKWTDSFDIADRKFSTIGKNRFFILKPGHQLTLESPEEKVVITVLDETKNIGGIKTRVVEEREEENGKLKEVSRNFFAICKKHGDVFYFGEEVDIYKDGNIVRHSGAWRADEKDSKAGIIMPGTILLGARHYQEIAPNAMDRAEIISDDVTLKTPAGTFTNCIKVEETSGVEPNEKCYKIYAPGIGMIQDEDLLLTKYSKANSKEEKVALEDLSPAVRAAIEKHAAGGKISEIEKQSKKGVLVYEAEVLKDGKEFDILISATGKFLGKEAEEATKHHHEKECDEDDDDEGHDKDQDG